MLGHHLEQARSPTGTYVRSYTKVTEKSLAGMGSRKSFTVNVLDKTRRNQGFDL